MSPPRNVAPVQWLRGLAAMMVVIHHARNPAASLPVNPLQHYDALAWGVDVFFAISGFIMFVAARDEPPLEFLKRRLVRVVPLYWLATAALAALSIARGSFGHTGGEWRHVVQSLLFVPHYSPFYPDKVWPYVVPGWTLDFEMFFYLVFFVALWVRRPLGVATTLILALVALGLARPTSSDALFVTYTNWLMLEFVVGMWVGWLFATRRLPAALAVGLPLGLAGLLAVPFIAPEEGSAWQAIARIACAGLTLAGAAALADSRWKAPALARLGDASYSIYLSHTLIGLPLAHRAQALLSFDGLARFVVWLVVATVISALAGIAIHRFVERPLLQVLRRSAPRPAAIRAGAQQA